MSTPTDFHGTGRLRAPGWGLHAAIQHAWLRRGPLAWALWPASWVYGLLVRGHQGLYRLGLKRPQSAGAPVVVVGNVVAGGAGKTPTVIALVHHLQARGWRPGVISRGHGRHSQGCLEVRPGDPAERSGDEPLLMAQRCGVPVFVAARRVEAARALLKAYPATDIVISDDGLQHHGLARDLSIAVFDDRGTGNGWLLPAGPLREPWPVQPASRVDLVLHTGQRPAFAGYQARRQLAGHALGPQGERVHLASLQPARLVALAAIARPQAFFDMLYEQGLRPEQTLALPDHHDLTGLAWLDDPTLTVLCTEKDAVKLFPRLEPGGARVLAVPLAFEPEAAFFEALDGRLQALKAADAPPHPLPSTHGHSPS